MFNIYQSNTRVQEKQTLVAYRINLFSFPKELNEQVVWLKPFAKPITNIISYINQFSSYLCKVATMFVHSHFIGEEIKTQRY